MSEPEPDIRERLLAAAERCFYREGIVASGVDTLAAEAGVSKRTLYNQFGSKEALVAAYLEAREQRWQAHLAQLVADAGDDPLEQVLAYARGYAMPTSGVFRGCAMINAAAELAEEDDPALALVQQSLDTVQRGVRRILRRAGLPRARAARLAQQTLIVLEGAISVGGVRRDAREVLAALDLLRDLLTPALAGAAVPAR